MPYPSFRSSFAALLPALGVLGTPLGAQGLQLNPPLVPLGDVTDFLVSPDSRYAVYRADQEINGKSELYSVALDYPFVVRKLNDAIGGSVSAFFRISPDSKRVVYRADASPTRMELFSVDIRGQGTSVRLNGTLVFAGDVSSQFEISRDSTRVVYAADQEANERLELYSVPITGGAALKLNATLPADGDVVGEFFLAPDSTRAVYAADQEVDERFELYSVPMDGSAPPTKISPVPVAGGGVFPLSSTLAISPDSAWVVFRGDLLVDERIELFSAPIDGSSPATRLHGDPLLSGGWIWWSAISPDSASVAYVVRQSSLHPTDLYSVAIDGSGPATQLDVSLGAGAGVGGAQITPDSSHVVFTGNQSLYSVPLDGSRTPVQLFEPLSGGYGVLSARVSADSARVVFIADLDTARVYELYSSPLVPALPSVTKLGSGPVLDFLLDPRGEFGLYRADQDGDGSTELWSVPLDGSRSPSRVTTPLAVNGQVVEYSLAPSGKRVLYRAGQEAQNVIELFETYLTPKLRPSR